MYVQMSFIFVDNQINELNSVIGTNLVHTDYMINDIDKHDHLV